MPAKYIHVERPPAWIVSALTERAGELNFSLTTYMSRVIQHACKNKELYETGTIPTHSAKDVYDGNLNIPADTEIKKQLKHWGKESGRTLTHQTLFVLKKSLSLAVDSVITKRPPSRS